MKRSATANMSFDASTNGELWFASLPTDSSPTLPVHQSWLISLLLAIKTCLRSSHCLMWLCNPNVLRRPSSVNKCPHLGAFELNCLSLVSFHFFWDCREGGNFTPTSVLLSLPSFLHLQSYLYRFLWIPYTRLHWKHAPSTLSELTLEVRKSNHRFLL